MGSPFFAGRAVLGDEYEATGLAGHPCDTPDELWVVHQEAALTVGRELAEVGGEVHR